MVLSTGCRRPAYPGKLASVDTNNSMVSTYIEAISASEAAVASDPRKDKMKP